MQLGEAASGTEEGDARVGHRRAGEGVVREALYAGLGWRYDRGQARAGLLERLDWLLVRAGMDAAKAAIDRPEIIQPPRP